MTGYLHEVDGERVALASFGAGEQARVELLEAAIAAEGAMG